MTLQVFDAEKQRVSNWLQDFIVGYNLCPFAKKPLVNHQIRLTICTAIKCRDILAQLMEEMHYLNTHQGTETSLLIFPHSLQDFYQYLEIVEACNEALVTEGYEGIYQIASFHPNYFFEGEAPEDASHYTNRSPYPIVHIIREESIERVLEQYKNPEQIPENNIEKMRQLGSEFLRDKLENL